MFEGMKLTNKGLEILTSLIAGHNIQFTKIKMGDGNKPEIIETLGDLVSAKQELPIARYSVVNETTMMIGSNLYGVDVREGFFWKEVGLFAKDLDGDKKEYLFSYDNAEEKASFIPKGGAVTEQLIDLNVVVGNAENVTIEIDKSLVFATAESLEEGLKTLEDTLTTKIDNDINDLNTKMNNHINNKQNPHEVTKDQVGLGSVQNYGIATKTEAETGSSNIKYMTPQRTKEAQEKYGVISDGNLIIKVQGTQPSVQAGKTIIWINTSS